MSRKAHEMRTPPSHGLKPQRLIFRLLYSTLAAHNVTKLHRTTKWKQRIMRNFTSPAAYFLCLLLSLALNAHGQGGGPAFELVIENGRIVDGTGNPWFPGDLGIKDGIIVTVGDLSDAESKRIIDAAGHVVSPGFIDIHNHSDNQVLTNPKAENYIRQGVTTIVVGNCGRSAVPSEEYPTFTRYFGAIERQGIAVNVVALIGHGSLREHVMGPVGRLSTPDEMSQMKRLVDQLLREGATGMSTGLGYAPGIYSDTDELVELSTVLATHNALYASHIRGDAATWRPAIEEAIEIGRRSGAAVQISHMESHYPNWGAQRIPLRLIEEARARGLDVTTDVPPLVRGATGLQTMLPNEALDGGPETIVRYLSDPEKRALCRRHVFEEKEIHNTPVPTLIADGFADHIFVEGVSLEEIANARGVDPVDAAFDILLENDGRIGVVLQHHYEPDLRILVASPLVMIESDGRIQTFGEGVPNPRSYGAFPLVFRKYVRGETRSEASEDVGMKILSLEEAVRKMTSFPAQKLGMKDRGMIRESMVADLVVFDPETISDTCTYTEPHQYPAGIPYVIVGGEVVVDQGRHTGRLTGQVLKSTRSNN